MQEKDLLSKEYSKRLKKIEEHISAAFPEKPDYSWAERVSADNSAELSDMPLSFFENINKPGVDLIERGGKRWRPMLMLLFSELAAAAASEAEAAAASEAEAAAGTAALADSAASVALAAEAAAALAPLVELAHNASLIIDDIEDSADFRRGKSAVHVLYGTDMSINSSNFMYFLPSIIIDNTAFNDKIKLKLYQLYNENMRRLHLGQGLDIQWHRRHDFFPSEEQYMLMCRYKTGSLARFAAEAGLLCGTAGKDAGAAAAAAAGSSASTTAAAAAGSSSSSTAAAAGAACELLGAGFQIMDDVLNLTTGNPGKRRGDDIVEGKKSLPVILFSRAGGDVNRLSALFDKAKTGGLEKGHDAVEEAIMLLESSGAIRKAATQAETIIRNAKEKITGMFEKSIPLDLICFMLDSFAEKNSS